MLETKDSAIKLFGKTIPILEVHVVDESIDDHHHDFSTNSSNESHNNKDAQEQEIEKVCIYMRILIFLFMNF